MKVFLVEKDNCESYEDNRKWISKAFKTYRGASQWLIDQSFEVYYETFTGVEDLWFFWQESDEYMAACEGARIIEMELADT